MEGLILALGFSSRHTLIDYQSKENYEQFHDLVRMTRLKITSQIVDRMFKGSISPASAIFYLKNQASETYKADNALIFQDN